MQKSKDIYPIARGLLSLNSMREPSWVADSQKTTMWVSVEAFKVLWTFFFTLSELLGLITNSSLSSTAVETHCQNSLSGPSGFRPCDDRYLLRDRNQQQQKKLSYPAHCCGDRSYNPSYQLCCRGRLLIKQPGKYCCGSLTYDPKSQLCCGGTVKTKIGSINACCGSVPYDSSKQSCCYGQLVSKPPAGQPSACCG